MHQVAKKNINQEDVLVIPDFYILAKLEYHN